MRDRDHGDVVLSSILVLLVVAGWAAYLVPFWFHRHDGAAAELRSIHGFSTAMRTLSRRTPTYVDGRYVLVPGSRHHTTTETPAAVHVSGAGVRHAAESRVVRRRQTLLGMLVVTVASTGAAFVIGGLAVWLAMGNGLAMTGYAVVLRRAAVREAQRKRRARQLAHRRRVLAEREAYDARIAAEAAARPVPRQPAVQAAGDFYDALEDVDEWAEIEWRRVVGQ
jgi:hypothetical protein